METLKRDKMGISDFISGVLEKNKAKKEEFKQMQREDKNLEKLEMKKLSPMERELTKYQKQDRERAITDLVLARRRKDKYESEMLNAPINQKSIFRDTKNSNVFQDKNIFLTKPKKPTKTIFVERRKI